MYRYRELLTEDQIECRAEKMMDRLDRLYMGGKIDQKEYDRQVIEIDQWSLQQHFANPLVLR